MHVREVLDEAVRCLAVSAAPLQQRLELSGTVILYCLSRDDFSFNEDRELFDQIGNALTASAQRDTDEPIGLAVQAMSDIRREQVAGSIVDLRDTLMGRAIREARVTRGHKHRQGDAVAPAGDYGKHLLGKPARGRRPTDGPSER